MTDPSRGATRRRLRFLVHNAVAHPLLIVAAAIDWFHDRTAPE